MMVVSLVLWLTTATDTELIYESEIKETEYVPRSKYRTEMLYISKQCHGKLSRMNVVHCTLAVSI